MAIEDGDYIAPYARLGPADARTPLVIAVPHAGRHYPAAIERARAVGWETLRQLEDGHADLLVRAAVAEGAVAIVATIARAWIDLNRAETEITPAASARARAGLGLIPARLSGRDLWRAEPDARAVAARIAGVHRPYHEAIGAALDAAQARHGFAVLIDCHSMPPLGCRGGRGAGVVIGDRHGASASASVVDAVARAIEAAGIVPALNRPYAGAFTLDRHGRPGAGRHAFQLEVDRALYLAPEGREPGQGLERIARLVAAIGWAAVDAASEGFAIAAE